MKIYQYGNKAFALSEVRSIEIIAKKYIHIVFKNPTSDLDKMILETHNTVEAEALFNDIIKYINAE